LKEKIHIESLKSKPGSGMQLFSTVILLDEKI